MTKDERVRLNRLYAYLIERRPEGVDYIDCIRDAKRLVRINRKLTALGIAGCCAEIDEDMQIAKENKLLQQCGRIARTYGSIVYYQGDMVYLVPLDVIKAAKYTIDSYYHGKVYKWLQAHYDTMGVPFEYKVRGSAGSNRKER